jgi:hypothetical protein
MNNNIQNHSLLLLHAPHPQTFTPALPACPFSLLFKKLITETFLVGLGFCSPCDLSLLLEREALALGSMSMGVGLS